MDNLTRTIRYLSGLIEKIVEETLVHSEFSDLTQQQFHYLQIIFRMKNPALSEFAREVGLTKPTVTVLVDKLTEKGYVRRVQSDQDRRVIHLQIDKKGARIGALHEIAIEKLVEKIRSVLNEKDTAILTRLLGRIVGPS